jgi:hypothetical protein
MNLGRVTAKKVVIAAVAAIFAFALLAPLSGQAQERKEIEVKAVDGAAFEAGAAAGPKAAEGISENIVMTMALGVAAVGTFYAAAPQVMLIGVGMGAAAAAGAIIYTKKKEADESRNK